MLTLIDRLILGQASTIDLTELRKDAFENLADYMKFSYCFVDGNGQIYVELGTGE